MERREKRHSSAALTRACSAANADRMQCPIHFAIFSLFVRPLDDQFNCIRFIYSLFLFALPSYYTILVPYGVRPNCARHQIAAVLFSFVFASEFVSLLSPEIMWDLIAFDRFALRRHIKQRIAESAHESGRERRALYMKRNKFIHDFLAWAVRSRNDGCDEEDDEGEEAMEEDLIDQKGKQIRAYTKYAFTVAFNEVRRGSRDNDTETIDARK